MFFCVFSRSIYSARILSHVGAGVCIGRFGRFSEFFNIPKKLVSFVYELYRHTVSNEEHEQTAYEDDSTPLKDEGKIVIKCVEFKKMKLVGLKCFFLSFFFFFFGLLLMGVVIFILK